MAKKGLLYGVGILILFSGSVVLGALSATPQQSQFNNAKQSETSDADTTTGTAKIEQASSDIPLTSPLTSQLQGTQTPAAAQQSTKIYEGKTMNVTIQRAPDNFRSNSTIALKQLAANMKAVKSVTTNAWGVCYVASSEETEVAMCATSDTFLVVQSLGGHSLPSWKAYLETVKG